VTHSYSQLLWIERNLRRNAAGGNDPRADLYYGLVIEGAPQLGVSPTTGLSWLVKAAQAGLPLAQFQVGYRLLTGLECRADLAKALKWLHMAADQNETSADVVLATRLLHGTPDAAATAQAKDWLERSVAGGNEYGELYLAAMLASVPQPQLRDPRRALLLLSKVYPGVDSDPTASEIRAAAQAAEGDFQDAVQSEQGAIAKAHKMGWNLSPLEHRLALYQSRKPWYGDLLAF
jgi:Sel1 repeat